MGMESRPQQKSKYEIDIEDIGKKEKEKALAELKEESLSLIALGLAGGRMADDITIPAETYGRHNNVIVFRDNNGQAYATPDSDQARKLLEKSGRHQDESIGVPSLNDGDVWGDKARRDTMPSWQKWRVLVERNSQRKQREEAESATN